MAAVTLGKDMTLRDLAQGLILIVLLPLSLPLPLTLSLTRNLTLSKSQTPSTEFDPLFEFVSTNPNICNPNMTQGVWRMRQIGVGQKANIVITPEVNPAPPS